MHIGKILTGLPLCVSLASPATAGLADRTIQPMLLPVGDSELKVDALAGGAVMAADQPGEDKAATGVAKLMPRLHRDYDSGMVLSLNGTFTLADPLSRGRYTNPIEKLFGEMQTGLGKVQIGLADGAGYALGLTGPKANAQIALEDAQISFFRDPVTHRAVTNMFALRTAVGSSYNFGKISYLSPNVFGVQLGFSYTPSEGKQLPFMNTGPNVPGRQTDMFELALRYAFDLGPVTVNTYLAGAEAHGERKLPGQQGLSDLGAGLRIDYPVGDSTTVSLGGSYRTTNAYAFDINRAYAGATTRALHVSAGLTDGDWSASLEYGNGVAGAVSPLGATGARLGQNGVEVSVGYALSPGVQLSTGWQHLNYGRGSGSFYDGSRKLSLDAVFLHLTARTTD